MNSAPEPGSSSSVAEDSNQPDKCSENIKKLMNIGDLLKEPLSNLQNTNVLIVGEVKHTLFVRDEPKIAKYEVTDCTGEIIVQFAHNRLEKVLKDFPAPTANDVPGIEGILSHIQEKIDESQKWFKDGDYVTVMGKVQFDPVYNCMLQARNMDLISKETYNWYKSYLE
ncbi:hypothetical protein DMENIID0001_154150 [Sergentomyia squamirostris]